MARYRIYGHTGLYRHCVFNGDEYRCPSIFAAKVRSGLLHEPNIITLYAQEILFFCA